MTEAILNKSFISEEEINVRYSDIDFDKKLKPFSLLNFFQDIASDNAERLGFGYSYIYPQNLMWVLLKYRIEFSEYPKDTHKLTLRTEPRGYNRFFAFRNFELLDGHTTIARASSTWSLVDINSLSVKNISDVITDNEYFGKYTPQEFDLKYEKIPAITQVDYTKEFEVRYNDLDVNMHANNGNYIVWALEPLPIEFRENHTLKNIDMMFKKEIKRSEKLISQIQILDNTTIHALKHAETMDDLCILKCEWI